MTGWKLFATIAEPIGVLLLSIEAIKLKNITGFRKRVFAVTDWLNPHIEFYDETDQPKHEIKEEKRSSILAILWALPAMVITAAFLALLYPLTWMLEKIEEQVGTGVIGILGFIFWFSSFVINRLPQ